MSPIGEQIVIVVALVIVVILIMVVFAWSIREKK
jgi:nitrogen fixation-related uncharacterized protein